MCDLYPWFTKEETEAQDRSVTYPRSPEKLEPEFQPEWVPESTWITKSNSGVGVGTCNAYVPAVEKSIGRRVLIWGVYLMRFSYENILISSDICRTVWKRPTPRPSLPSVSKDPSGAKIAGLGPLFPGR